MSTYTDSVDRRPRHRPILHSLRRIPAAVLHRRQRAGAGIDAHDPDPTGLLPPRHSAAVGLVHRLCVGPPGMGWSDIVPGARYEEARPACGGGRVRHRPRPPRRHPRRGIARRRARATRGRRPQGVASPGLLRSTRTTTRAASSEATCSPGSSSAVSACRALGAVFAAMENRPIMKGIMRGGVVDNRTLPDDFVVELRKSGRRKGYPGVARAVYRSLKGFVKARDRYRDVAVPVTLVYSDEDWSRPAEREHVADLLAEVERITPARYRPLLRLGTAERGGQDSAAIELTVRHLADS